MITVYKMIFWKDLQILREESVLSSFIPSAIASAPSELMSLSPIEVKTL